MRVAGAALWLAAFALGLACGLAPGCGDDRARVASDIFFCNPLSPTADADCGDNYVCYTATQSLGSSICVPRCDPKQPSTCPNGACTAAGECLQRCTVSKKDCPSSLVCVSTTISPLEAGKNDGVCLPVNSSCSQNSECTSPIFNVCSSETNIITPSPDYVTAGSVCAQGKCASNHTACEPGSSCVADVLPSTVSTPDVCAPNCVPHKLPDGGVAEECLVGFTCLDIAFPETSSQVCAPGFAGWLCKDPLGCVAGDCDDWEDVGLDEFFTCAPDCHQDSDCNLFDRLVNPDFQTKMICNPGGCRNQQSLFFPLLCLKAGNTCALDPKARCVVSGPPDGGTKGPHCAPPIFTGDGGVPLDMGSPLENMPLGALGGTSAVCERSCMTDDDCAMLSANSHEPMVCYAGLCMPPVPFVVPCHDGQVCIGDLQCLAVGTSGGKTCTRTCETEADCSGDNALGGAFTCAGGICIPKISSGCPNPSQVSSLCLSGIVDGNGKCVSPKGWVCDDDSECQHDVCVGGRCT